jgi:hypothetical protein
MRKHCAQTGGLAGEGLAAARLACLQGLHPVTLNGKSLQGLHYEIASDPRTDRPALLAMIDVQSLAPGRHELRIGRPPRGDRGQPRSRLRHHSVLALILRRTRPRISA